MLECESSSAGILKRIAAHHDLTVEELLNTRFKSSGWHSLHCSSRMPPSVPSAWLEKSFQDALPKALRLVELTEEFLKQKDAERNAYWDTPEGKEEREERWAQIKARYEK